MSSDENVELLHHLEQVSTEGMVGSLAENLVEALIKFPIGKEKIEQVRDKTRMEKKRLAMAMRQKQLESLGMMVSQLTIRPALLWFVLCVIIGSKKTGRLIVFNRGEGHTWCMSEEASLST